MVSFAILCFEVCVLFVSERTSFWGSNLVCLDGILSQVINWLFFHVWILGFLGCIFSVFALQ
jgi:hypothetical protein